MNKIITNRQIIYAIIMMSLAPIHKHIPKAVSSVAGSAGYISVAVGGIVTLSLAFGVYYTMKKFPAQNLYDILKILLGNFGAKTVALVCAVWAGINLTTILHFQSLMSQSTLFPFTPDRLIFAVMLALVGYCLYKGIKVAMRISELLMSVFLIIILSLVLVSLQNFDAVNLLPVTLGDTPDILKASFYPISIFGFIIFALFYSDKLDKPQDSFKPYAYYSLSVFLIAFIITVTTIGVEGAELSASYTFPFYSVVNRASLLNIFERLEAFLLLPTFFSDFIQLAFFASVLLLSLKWLFGIDKLKFGAVFVLAAVYFISLTVEKTQFELQHFYYNYLVLINSGFEYALVLLIVIMTLIRHKKVKEQMCQM